MKLFDKTQKNTQENQKVQVYNLIIVDESGSMSSLKEATINGVNETLATIREAQKQYADKQNHLVTLVTFDSGTREHDVRTLIDAAPIGSVGQFNEYNPWGSTPLLDAVGMSLIRLEAKMNSIEMATAVVTIITDGYENSSKRFSYAEVKALIERLTERGWTFAYMGSDHDVAAVSQRLSISNCMQFAHTETGTSSSWRRERGSKMKLFRWLNEDYDELSQMDHRERARKFASYNTGYYANRVTPPVVDHLSVDEVFVFGSNIHGDHNGGAAGLAWQRFGAIMGQAEGPQGQSYAIPTTTGNQPLPLRDVARSVMQFISYARQNPQRMFYVTAIECGNAGFTPREIAPLWREAIELENVALPQEFWSELGITL